MSALAEKQMFEEQLIEDFTNHGTECRPGKGNRIFGNKSYQAFAQVALFNSHMFRMVGHAKSL